VPGSLDKKAEENATFCLTKDATFFPLFLSNEPGTGVKEYAAELSAQV
jgi:hypothetical protein